MTAVTSYQMQSYAQNEEYQLGATGAKKVAAYMAYAFGGSFFVGLIRLIAALGALCVDYKAKAMAQEYQKSIHAASNQAGEEGNEILPNELHVHNVEGGIDMHRVQDVGSGIEMCKKDIFSHWEQVTRAIVELTVVGAWIYAVIEAVQQYRSEAEGSVDALDWGRCKGMLGRITSNFADRQYVPEDMMLHSQLTQNDVDLDPADVNEQKRVNEYGLILCYDLLIEQLQQNPSDWNISAVRACLVNALNTPPTGEMASISEMFPIPKERVQLLQGHGFEYSEELQAWVDPTNTSK